MKLVDIQALDNIKRYDLRVDVVFKCLPKTLFDICSTFGHFQVPTVVDQDYMHNFL